MKNVVLVLAITGYMCNITLAQCNLKVDEIDKFTGIKKVETKMEVLHKDYNSSIGLSFCSQGAVFFLKVNMNFNGKVYSIYKGNELLLLTEKGSKLILKSVENEISSGYGEIFYPISLDDLNIIGKERITDLRIHFAESHVDKIIDDKKAEKIMNLCRCLNQ